MVLNPSLQEIDNRLIIQNLTPENVEWVQYVGEKVEHVLPACFNWCKDQFFLFNLEQLRFAIGGMLACAVGMYLLHTTKDEFFIKHNLPVGLKDGLFTACFFMSIGIGIYAVRMYI